MRSELNELKNKIDDLKQQLESAMLIEQVCSDQVLKLSEELDVLITNFYFISLKKK